MLPLRSDRYVPVVMEIAIAVTTNAHHHPDPDQVAERTSPHLTSVAIPAQDLGRRAVELLARRLADSAGSEVVLLPPRLAVRGSTAPRDT